MKDYFASHIEEAAEWIIERNNSDRAKIEAERPGIEFIEWGDDQVAKARGMAQVVWEEAYPGIAGEGAVEALEILLEDIENAKDALGID